MHRAHDKCPSVSCTFGNMVIKHQWQGLFIFNKASFSLKALNLYQPIVKWISFDSGLVPVAHYELWKVDMGGEYHWSGSLSVIPTSPENLKLQ